MPRYVTCDAANTASLKPGSSHGMDGRSYQFAEMITKYATNHAEGNYFHTTPIGFGTQGPSHLDHPFVSESTSIILSESFASR
jgi:hypothetical protein